MSLETLPENWSESSTSARSPILCKSQLENFLCGSDHTAPQRWQEEACHVISEASSLDEIRLILSYIPLPRNTLSDLLSKRLSSPFLYILHNKKPNTLDQISKDVEEEIFGLLGPKPLSSSMIWDWKWTPPIVSSMEDTARVAEVIDFNVCRMFCKIPFWAWVRAWLGHEEDFVTCFMEGVSNISNELYQYLQKFHQSKHIYEIAWYKQVEEVSPVKIA
jgi:hypothetical protein